MGAIAIPYVFAALMVVEFVFNAIARNGHQDARDSAVSVMVAVPHFALLTIVPVVWFVAYRELEPLVPGALPADAWWIWPLGIVLMDLAAYWMHRYHHALNVTWAVHSVHHSSEHMTVTTGARSSMAEPLVNIVSAAYLILIVPALVGLPVAAAGVGWLVKDTWGFAVHTRNIDRLGPLEYVLATPSHHRVHHATNAVYAGKNYGFVFIVWDKLFGTFQPERRDITAVYGTSRPPGTYQPLAVAFCELHQLWRDCQATRSWRDKLRLWFMPAGWRPQDAPPVEQRALPEEPPALYLVGGLQLALIVGCIGHLALTVPGHDLVDNLGYLAFIVLGTAVAGEYFDRSPRVAALECIRVLVLLLVVAVTGTWFGRSLDLGAVLIALLATASLGASLVYARADTRPGRRASRHHAARARRELVRLLPGRAAADRSGTRRESAGSSRPDRGW